MTGGSCDSINDISMLEHQIGWEVYTRVRLCVGSYGTCPLHIDVDGGVPGGGSRWESDFVNLEEEFEEIEIWSE